MLCDEYCTEVIKLPEWSFIFDKYDLVRDNSPNTPNSPQPI